MLAQTAASILRSAAAPRLSAQLQLLAKSNFATGASRVIELKDDAHAEKELDALAASGNLGILDFTAKWCGPCRSIAPVYDALSAQYPDAKFFKVDIDNAELAGIVNKHAISSVPTFTFYKAGKQLGSFSGAQQQLLKDILAQHAGPAKK